MAQSAKQTKPQLVYFELHPSRKMRVKGVHLVSDINNPDSGERIPVKEEFPRYLIVPNTDTIFTKKDGEIYPKQIRYIKGCPTLDMEEQKKRGYVPNGGTEDEIEVINGGLIFDVSRNPILYEYLQVCNYVSTNPDRNPECMILIMQVDRDKQALESLNEKYKVARAISRIELLTDEEASNLMLKRGFIRDEQMTVSAIKDFLADIASTDPDFILEGIKDQRDRRSIIARKAIEQGYITLHTPATVSWVEDSQPKAAICKVGDLGGEEGKLERFVEFLATQEGTIVMSRLVDLVGEVTIGDFDGDSLAYKPYVPKREEPGEEEGEEDENELVSTEQELPRRSAYKPPKAQSGRKRGRPVGS